MNDRTGQIWSAGSGDSWQIFLVLGEAIERNGCYEHMRLIVGSNWPTWPGNVAPYPEAINWPWERNHDFTRMT